MRQDYLKIDCRFLMHVNMIGKFKGGFYTMKKTTVKAKYGTKIWCKAKAVLQAKAGESYVDTGVKILIAVVIGALLLAGLYTLFGDVVMPTLTRRITEMFNYAG